MTNINIIEIIKIINIINLTYYHRSSDVQENLSLKIPPFYKSIGQFCAKNFLSTSRSKCFKIL